MSVVPFLASWSGVGRPGAGHTYYQSHMEIGSRLLEGGILSNILTLTVYTDCSGSPRAMFVLMEIEKRSLMALTGH